MSIHPPLSCLHSQGAVFYNYIIIVVRICSVAVLLWCFHTFYKQPYDKRELPDISEDNKHIFDNGRITGNKEAQKEHC